MPVIAWLKNEDFEIVKVADYYWDLKIIGMNLDFGEW